MRPSEIFAYKKPDNVRGPRSTISLKRSTHIRQRSTRRPADYPICYSNNDRSRHEADLTRSANYGSRSQMSILYVTRTFQARSVSIGEENEVCYGPRFAMKTH